MKKHKRKYVESLDMSVVDMIQAPVFYINNK